MFKERGRLHLIGETTITEKSQYRDIILDTTRRDPYTGEVAFENYIKITANKAMVDELNQYHVGDIVELDGYFNGGLFDPQNGEPARWYTRLTLKSIRLISGALEAGAKQDITGC